MSEGKCMMDNCKEGYTVLPGWEPLFQEEDSVPLGSDRDFSDLFARLAQSDFRRRFHLKLQDKEYVRQKGLDLIRHHAQDFVRKRIAPSRIPNDGKQTPMRGHPVFIAQHATACCCRGCLNKWHHIPAGRELSPEEQAYVVDVLMAWIRKEMGKN